MKKNILLISIGLILGISITIVSAAILYKATDVEYTNPKSESTNVQDAINEIFSTGDATAEDILEGKIALVNGEKIIGNLKSTKSPELISSLKVNRGSSYTYTFDKDYSYVMFTISYGTEAGSPSYSIPGTVMDNDFSGEASYYGYISTLRKNVTNGSTFTVSPRSTASYNSGDAFITILGIE